MKRVGLRFGLVLAIVLMMVGPAWAGVSPDPAAFTIYQGEMPEAYKLYLAANDAYACGDFCKAAELFTAVIKTGSLAPANLATAHNRLGMSYERLGNPAEALYNYELAVKTVPKYPLATMNLEALRDKLRAQQACEVAKKPVKKFKKRAKK